MKVNDDFWNDLKKQTEHRLSMITRKDIDDNTRIEILDFVVGEEVSSIKDIRNKDNEIEELILCFKSGRRLSMYHDYDCCESVILIDIIGGNIEGLIGQEITCIKSVSKQSNDKIIDNSSIYIDDSNTWTFITISTFKDGITLRWHGSSNGFYSEDVDFAYYDENNNRIY